MADWLRHIRSASVNSRQLRRGAVGGGVLLAIVLGSVLTFVTLRAQEPAPAVSPAGTPGSGTARIFAGASTAPFVVELRDVQKIRSEAGMVVRLTATFGNHGRTSYRADPGDFQLQDAHGDKWPVSFDAVPDCAAWEVTPVQPSAGLGPVPLCFRTASLPHEPLEVTWDPDVSFVLFSGPAAVIPLP